MFKTLIKLMILLIALAGAFIIGQFFTGTTYWNNAAWNRVLQEQTQARRAEVGRVVKLKGVVMAGYQDTDRALKVDDAVREGDFLHTGIMSRLRIQFHDGGVLTLGEKSRFLVEKYPRVPNSVFPMRASLGELLIPPAHAEEDLPQPVLSMKRGIFSYVSGKLAQWLKSRKAPMTVFSPVATMGIRGTTLWSRLHEFQRPTQSTPERTLDVLCLVPSCSVQKGQQEQVMDVPNTTLQVAESRPEVPKPVLASPEQVTRAQISVVIPKDLPKPMVEKIQQEMIQSLVSSGVVQSHSEAVQIVQATLETMVARTEMRLAAKALEEIQQNKRVVSDAELQHLLELEARKEQSHDQYFKNVEELMKLKGGKKHVDENDRDSVEQMQFPAGEVEQSSREVMASTVEKYKKQLKDGKTIQEILEDKEPLKELQGGDDWWREGSAPLSTQTLSQGEVVAPTVTIEEKVKEMIEAERKEKLDMAARINAITQEVEALTQRKQQLENELALQQAKNKSLEKELSGRDTGSTFAFSPTAGQTLAPLEESKDESTEIPLSQELESSLTVLNRLFTEPEMLGKISAIQNDPDFKKALENSELRLLLAQGRYARAVFHPDFVKLLKHPAIQDLLALTKTVQKETYPMGTLTGSTVYAGASTTGSGVTDLTQDYDALLGIPKP